MRLLDLFRQVCGQEMRPGDDALHELVRGIRVKLTEAAPAWIFIHTYSGVGYSFSPQRRCLTS